MNNNENYLDYMVEEEVAIQPKNKIKSYPLTKILALALGVVGGLCLLYYVIEVYKQYFEQFKMIEEYKTMGMVIGFKDMFPYYLSMGLMAVMCLAPIVGGVLPIKFKSTSIILLTLPVSWQLINVLPSLFAQLAQPAEGASLAIYYVITIGSLLCLAAAILNTFGGKTNTCSCEVEDEDIDIEYFEYEDDAIFDYDTMETDEEAEDVVEISEEAADETEESATEPEETEE